MGRFAPVNHVIATCEPTLALRKRLAFSRMELIWWVLAVGGFCAGFIDAVAGGGGLIQLPVLMAVFPTHSPATLFGTNKCASIWGTLAAASQYLRRITIPWHVLMPAVLMALIGAWFGASVVSQLRPEVLRPAVLVLLTIVAYYTFTRHDLGLIHAPRFKWGHEIGLSALIGAGLGFYDGVFGPGTGAFLVFLFVRILRYDFLHASALSKVINTATNLAALAYFVPAGHVLWKAAGIMAICNVGGAGFGSYLALKHGSRFVRRVFAVMVVGLIVKIAHQTFVLK
jgi:uncharacterized protein